MIAVLPLALLYAVGVARVRRWLWWRSAAFGLGLATLAIALELPDAALASHMTQHLLLTAVAAPLLVLGAPHVLALRSLHGEARAALARLLDRHGPASPFVTFPIFATVMLGTHLTPFFDYANRHPLAHGVEHALLLASSILFWVPVLAAAPARRLGPLGRVGYLFAGTAPMGAIGVAFGGEAGAIMWVGGGYALLVAVLAAVWAALVAEERRQRARETYQR
ncbi:MAG TPA: cytochrome c oxidase assembly protein [Thermoleophilaceae bacterium]|jgi:cytochrome c oxidase assembly factor CtaG